MPDTSDSVAPYMGRTLATVAAVLSIVATVVGGWSAWRAKQAEDQAKATQLELDQVKLANEYQIKVFELIDKSLASEQGGLILASAYTSSLKDQALQASLTNAIRVVAQSRQGVGKLTPEEAAALQILQTTAREAAGREIAADAEASAPAKVAAVIANPLSTAGVTQAKVNVKAVNPVGWDVDVFWCEGVGEPSRALANAVARDLGAVADAGAALGGQKLGRIRVRELRTAVAQRGNLPQATNEVRADEGEDTLADATALVATAQVPAKPFRRIRSNSGTKWYLSVFACGV